MAMRKTFSGLCVTVLLLLFMVVLNTTHALPTPLALTGKIYGNVIDVNGTPISSAKINLKGKGTKTRFRATSNESGYFEFNNLEADTYNVKIQNRGYRTIKQEVILGEGEGKEIDTIMGYDVSGKWRGYMESNLVPRTSITLTLNQSGNKASGSLKGEDGQTGTINGTIDEDNIEFKLKTTTQGCPGSFKGIATIIDVDNMDLTFQGSDCGGKHIGYGYVSR